MSFLLRRVDDTRGWKKFRPSAHDDGGNLLQGGVNAFAIELLIPFMPSVADQRGLSVYRVDSLDEAAAVAVALGMQKAGGLAGDIILASASDTVIAGAGLQVKHTLGGTGAARVDACHFEIKISSGADFEAVVRSFLSGEDAIVLKDEMHPSLAEIVKAGEYDFASQAKANSATWTTGVREMVRDQVLSIAAT